MPTPHECTDKALRVIAHEIRNCLTPSVGFAQLLEAMRDDQIAANPEAVRRFAKCISVALRAGLMLVDGRPDPLAVECCDPCRVVQDVAEVARMQAPRCRVLVQLPERALRAAVNAGLLYRALTNLARNALEAMASADILCPGLAFHVTADARKIWIRVEDCGPGIDPALAARIFSGQTTKGDGHGLGLRHARRSLGRAHGRLKLESTAPGVGTVFRVTLPVAAAAAAAVQPNNAVRLPGGWGESTLLAPPTDESARAFRDGHE
jgi:signal transduction histidine kinase